MKKALMSCLAVMMTFGLLTGCGGKDGGGSATPAAAEENTLYYFNNIVTDNTKAAWEEIFADFEAETGIKVVATWQGTWDEGPQILNTMKLSKTPVDVYVQGVGLIQSPLGPGALVKDLTPYIGDDILSRYEDGLLDSCYMGGHLWCLPMADGGTWCIMYNKTMFEELGLEVPTTFEELKAAADVISAEKGITPMMISGKDGWTWPGLFMSTYGEATDGDAVAEIEKFLNGEKTFTTDAEVKAFQWIADLFDAGIMKADSFDTDGTGMIASFVQQKVAMIFVLDSYDAYIGDPGFEYGVMPYPVMGDAKDFYFGFGVGDGSLCMSTTIDPSHVDYALKFMEFATRPENAKKVLMAEKPEGTKVKIFKDIDAASAGFVTELNDVCIKHGITYLDWIYPGQVNDVFCQVIPALCAGTMTAEQAAAEIQKSLDTLKKESNYIYAWWDNFTDEQKALVYGE